MEHKSISWYCVEKNIYLPVSSLEEKMKEYTGSLIKYVDYKLRRENIKFCSHEKLFIDEGLTENPHLRK